MKFRSTIEFDPGNPDASNINVKTLAGHCAIVGTEWRELPPALHGAAIKAGCEVDKGSFRAEEHETKPSKQAKSQDDEAALTAKAIKALLKSNEANDFTTDGIPKVAAVSRVAGFTVSKADVMAAWNDINAEAGE